LSTRTTRFKSLGQLWPLMRDPRIPFWAKAAIPAIAAAYVISPVDVIPDFLLGAGQIDDIGVILLAASATVAFLQKFFANQQPEPEPARVRTDESSSAGPIYDASYRVK
jgi:uncharacterized membrane protein YkvA (DUF1232 family)